MAAVDLKEYRCPVYTTASLSADKRSELLVRPVKTSEQIQELCKPILASVRERGDAGLRECVVKFDRFVGASDESVPLTLTAPFSDDLARIDPAVKEAIDVAYNNIKVRTELSTSPTRRRADPRLSCRPSTRRRWSGSRSRFGLRRCLA